MGGDPRHQGAPDQLPFFYLAVLTLKVEKTFTNHKFRVDQHVTFGLNDRRNDAFLFSITAGQPKVLDTGIWLFCFDTLCQLAYMIYITNANAKINMLTITAGCYNAPNWLEGVELGQLIFRKIFVEMTCSFNLVGKYRTVAPRYLWYCGTTVAPTL